MSLRCFASPPCDRKGAVVVVRAGGGALWAGGGALWAGVVRRGLIEGQFRGEGLAARSAEAWASRAVLGLCTMPGSLVTRARVLFWSAVCAASLVSPVGCKERHSTEQAPAAPKVGSKLPRSHEKPALAHRTQPQAPLEQFVQQHVEEADVNGKRVLVYVGASWCEPCQRFHKSLESGELDDVLAGTEFLEFDADRDRTELRTAGYASKYIPLFSVPDPSGHASGLAIEGSIKGDAAVRQDLVPRLLALLDGKATD